VPPFEKGPARRTPPPAVETAPEHDLGVGMTDELGLRVSVGTLARVLLRDPEDARTMIALERTATLREVEGQPEVALVAKPFGGGIRIVDPDALREAIGAFRYDSDRSRRERDFRIQIRPDSWDAVKDVCRRHLREASGCILDTSPERELAEEFEDAVGTRIERSQYRLQPVGMRIEDTPGPTRSVRAPGRPTVRVYYVFEVWLEAPEIVESILKSNRATDDDLRTEALRDSERGGRGRANAALVLGLEELRWTYLALPTTPRDEPVTVRGHHLAGNVSAVLDDSEAQQLHADHPFAPDG